MNLPYLTVTAATTFSLGALVAWAIIVSRLALQAISDAEALDNIAYFDRIMVNPNFSRRRAGIIFRSRLVVVAGIFGGLMTFFQYGKTFSEAWLYLLVQFALIAIVFVIEHYFAVCLQQARNFIGDYKTNERRKLEIEKDMNDLKNSNAS